MTSVSKTLTLTLIIYLLSSLLVIVVTPVSVHAASKPSVPQFTLKCVDKSYNVPPTQTTDPYTGTPITQPGYCVENKVVEITIKNQNYPNLRYNVRTKGHFEQEWREEYGVGRQWPPEQSNGKYTVIELDTIQSRDVKSYPDGAQIDFQVEAMDVTYKREFTGVIIDEFFEGLTSDWSKTQTITVTYGSSTSSSSQTAVSPENSTVTSFINQTFPESQLPNFMFHPLFLPLVTSFLFVGVVVAVVMVFIRRQLKTPNYNNQPTTNNHTTSFPKSNMLYNILKK